MKIRPLLKESLILLNVNGLNPLKSNKIHIFIAYLSWFIYSTLSLNVMLDLCFKWKGIKSADTFAGFVGTQQIVAKMHALILNRKNLRQILYSINYKFWKLERCGKELQNKINNIYRLLRRIMMIMVLSYTITLITFYSKPLIYDSEELPISVFYPSDLTDLFIFWAMYAYELVMVLLIALPSLIGFDFLFISLIVHIVNEFKVIKFRLQEIQQDCNVERLNSIIDHHNVVLNCVKRMSDTYTLVLLNEFLTSTFIIFLGLLSIISEGFPPAFEQFMKPVPYLLTFSGTIFLYSFAGVLLIEESQNVSDAAYETKWWFRTQPEFRKRIAMIVQRANKIEKLTAGGMFDLKLSSFASVMRMAFSFFTLAQAVLTRNSGKYSVV